MDKYLVVSTKTDYTGKSFSSECKVKQYLYLCLTEEEAMKYLRTDNNLDFERGILTQVKSKIIKIADEDIGFIEKIDLGTYGHSE